MARTKTNILKLTPEIVKKLCYAIDQGTTKRLACQYAGISHNTYRNWYRLGELLVAGIAPKQISAQNSRFTLRKAETYSQDILSDFEDFFLLIQEAEGRAAVRWLELVDDAAVKDWRAAAWKLERRFPAEYGKQVKVQQDITSGGEVLTGLIDSALQRVYGDDDSDDISDGDVIDTGEKLRLSEGSNGELS